MIGIILYQILKVIHQVGEDPLTVSRDMPYLTIEGRRRSFQDLWLGPPANLMAECGLYKMSEGTRINVGYSTCMLLHFQCVYEQKFKIDNTVLQNRSCQVQ